MKDLVRALVCVALLTPFTAPSAMARIWKPTPAQMAQDYSIISHNKGTDGRVVIQWIASPGITVPTMQQLLDKYVVISVTHTRQAPTGFATWDDIEGVQVSDSKGQPLKELPRDTLPPALVGLLAQFDATTSQTTQGKAKIKWLIFEPGAVSACAAGGLSVAFEGENYTFETPMPGCAKP